MIQILHKMIFYLHFCCHQRITLIGNALVSITSGIFNSTRLQVIESCWYSTAAEKTKKVAQIMAQLPDRDPISLLSRKHQLTVQSRINKKKLRIVYEYISEGGWNFAFYGNDGTGARVRNLLLPGSLLGLRAGVDRNLSEKWVYV